LAEVDPVNLPPLLQSANPLAPESMRAEIEHIKWILYQLRVRSGGDNDTLADVETVNSIDNSLVPQSADIRIKIDEILKMQAFDKIPAILKRLDEIEKQLSMASKFATLERRISDLELQQ
jgi:hypothetical protein